MDTSKFNAMMDVEALKRDIANASKGGDFEDVPHGLYEVSVDKLELGETGEKSRTPGAPMLRVWFKVINGDYTGQRIFMNQVLTTGFGFRNANELLASLETGIEVKFEDFDQYDQMLNDIFAAVTEDKSEYALNYGENAKGFNTFTIMEKF